MQHKAGHGVYSSEEADTMVTEIGNAQNITPDIMVIPVL